VFLFVVENICPVLKVSPELLLKRTRTVKINLKRQSEPEFGWLSSQQDPVKIQLEMVAQWSKY
jgi:hypothetical protein